MVFVLVALTLFAGAFCIGVLALKSRTGLTQSTWWGVRTGRTMATPEAFAHANRSVWWLYALNAAVLFAQGVGVLILVARNASYEALAIFVLAGSVLVLVIAGVQVLLANRAAS